MPNYKNISFSHTSKFVLSFPFLPFLDTPNQKERGESVTLNCSNVVLPGMTITPTTIENAGYHDFKIPNSDIKFGDMAITYHVDEMFENYEMLYTWLLFMKNPETWSTQDALSGMVNASLHIATNNDNLKFRFTLVNFWPTALGSLTFNKADTTGDDLENTATFTMDYWKLERA